MWTTKTPCSFCSSRGCCGLRKGGFGVTTPFQPSQGSLNASSDLGACPPRALSSVAVSEGPGGPQSIWPWSRAGPLRISGRWKEWEIKSVFPAGGQPSLCWSGTQAPSWEVHPLCCPPHQPMGWGWGCGRASIVGQSPFPNSILLLPTTLSPQMPCSYSFSTHHSKMGSFLFHLSRWRKKALLPGQVSAELAGPSHSTYPWSSMSVGIWKLPTPHHMPDGPRGGLMVRPAETLGVSRWRILWMWGSSASEVKLPTWVAHTAQEPQFNTGGRWAGHGLLEVYRRFMMGITAGTGYVAELYLLRTL